MYMLYLPQIMKEIISLFTMNTQAIKKKEDIDIRIHQRKW